MKAEVVGKRKREIGLVVPFKYKALTSNVKCATVFSEKLNKKTRAIELYIHKTIYKRFRVTYDLGTNARALKLGQDMH